MCSVCSVHPPEGECTHITHTQTCKARALMCNQKYASEGPQKHVLHICTQSCT